MELKLNIDGQNYTLEQLLPMYTLANLANQLEELQTQMQTQVNFLMNQINEIEPDVQKQAQAIAIVQYILAKFPR